MTQAPHAPPAHAVTQPLADTGILLVACDFDGTLSELVQHPGDARVCEHCWQLLRELAGLPRTYAAVISGRSLAQLQKLLPQRGRVLLVGGHGAEPEFAPMTTGASGSRSMDILNALSALAHEFPGSLVEPKPAGPALHYRHVDPQRRDELLSAAAELAERFGVAPLRHGKLVAEFPIVRADKGAALGLIRDRCAATATLFLGDDVTDEDGFAVMQPQDLGVKVGEPPTKARAFVQGVAGVRELLRVVLDQRRASLDRDAEVPIDAHTFLSDQRSFALGDALGRICWLGAPRADAPPIFASILGGAAAGYFRVAPADGGPGRCEFFPDSFLVRTNFPGFTVVDYLDASAGRAFQRAGRSDLIRAVEGSGRVAMMFAPRLDFGRASTRLIPHPAGLVVQGSNDPIVLYSPGVQWTIEPDGHHHTARAEMEIPPGGLLLELRVGSPSLGASPLPEAKRRAACDAFWTGWAKSLTLPPLHELLLRRSALVIKALCHGPTGAILAAGTTSLPEQLGGVRNWDYRFCWVRDAALSASALIRLNSPGHAMKYLDWLTGVVSALESPERLRPIYTASGEMLGPEGELADLPGYARGKPVRVGNGAAHQVQLDVFGPVAEVIYLLASVGAPLTPAHRHLQDAMVEAVARRWHEPDNGIWEIRGPLRHHVHSKVCCWMTIDRAIQTRQALGEPLREEEVQLRDRIRDDVLSHGFHQGRGTFTASYESEELDAGALMVGLSGMLDPTDPRFVSTVHAIEKGLCVGDGVMRYLYDDGLPGQEGVFHICTGWLIEALHLIGETRRARVLLDSYAAQVGPLGLYSEERDPHLGLALGNYPQAYSHLALINACVRLSGG